MHHGLPAAPPFWLMSTSSLEARDWCFTATCCYGSHAHLVGIGVQRHSSAASVTCVFVGEVGSFAPELRELGGSQWSLRCPSWLFPFHLPFARRMFFIHYTSRVIMLLERCLALLGPPWCPSLFLRAPLGAVTTMVVYQLHHTRQGAMLLPAGLLSLALVQRLLSARPHT